MQNSLPSLLEVGRTKALQNEDSPWAAGQLLSHFTDGFAEA